MRLSRQSRSERPNLLLSNNKTSNLFYKHSPICYYALKLTRVSTITERYEVWFLLWVRKTPHVWPYGPEIMRNIVADVRLADAAEFVNLSVL